ncbi:hypothetical protein VMT65_37735 [Nocardia sp. CDC153]|uniref:hypothetical protein n=1 Tax=Nocardia sp. CDC153 TaxID=3112167 RepID=UPI002DB83260|nr:hypothetical protein [Nocardia sp. CDC153]MEC3958828.1 hypothetical protein [Nocardia sp. CDC153]
MSRSTGRQVATVIVGCAMTVAALAGCSHSQSEKPAADPDTADCTTGGRAIGGLQDTFTALSAQLNGIGPASDRGDLTEVGRRVREAARLSGLINADLHSTAGTMTSPLPRRAFTAVANAGAALHDSLTQLAQAVDGASPPQETVDSVQRSLHALDTSVEGMRLSCSTVFADSTVAPQTPAGPTPRPVPAGPVAGPGIRR